jgi:hypothetical protein
VANKVFANGREVACKAGAGKTICATPDVCMTPPENPATPPGVPVPYPNTGLASDTTEGSKNVMISGEEVTLKNVSYFKKSSGDEAGCAAKKGVISSKNTGKVYFIGWSMNVKVEGKNAARHLDQTTNNHASPAANESIPWPFVDSMTRAQKKKCAGDKRKEKKACKEYKPYKKNGKDVCKEAGLSGAFSTDKATATKRAKSASANKCAAARRCRLLPFDAKPEDGIKGCCPSQTGDHIVPKSSFFKTSVAAGTLLPGWKPVAGGATGYKINKAPCMCAEGGSCTGTHGLRHSHHKAFSSVASGDQRAFKEEMKHCAKGAKAIAPQCNQACLEAQLTQGHKDMGDTSGDVKHSPTGKNFSADKPGLLAKIKGVFTKGPAATGP